MSRRPKVAILASFPGWLISDEITNPGGHYAVWLVSLFEHFSKEALPFEIHWISLHKGIRKAIRKEAQGQFFHFLPQGSLRLGQLTRYIRESWEIKREIKRIQPDILHSWGTETFYAWSVRKSSIPKILSMQGMLTAYAKRAPMPKFQINQAKLEGRTLPLFDCITAESEWGVERCRELAPNAIIKRWEYAANEIFYNTERILSDTPCCLLGGTDTPIKNVPCAIAAFSKPELKHIKLYLAGIHRETLPSLPPNIIPLGRVSRNNIADLLSQTWCLVHPSLADTCPNIVKEARVIGVPAVVTTECGAKQYIQDGISGCIIPCNDVEALASAVLRIVESPKRSIEMGMADRERCRIALSSDTMYHELMDIYREILSVSKALKC